MLRKVLITAAVVILVVLLGGGAFVASRQNLKFDPPYPDVAASTDSAVIARGDVHRPRRRPVRAATGTRRSAPRMHGGAEIPLSGGFMFDIPPGKIYARNLTPDAETGLGQCSRRRHRARAALRRRPRRPGAAAVHGDAGSLRRRPARGGVVPAQRSRRCAIAVPAHQYTLLGKVVKATVLAKPVGPATPPPARRHAARRVENGRYLVESVALCGACHTQRNEMTGAFTGPRFGGATGFTEADDPDTPGPRPTSPVTPRPAGSALMTEDQFVARFRAGPGDSGFAHAVAGVRAHARGRSAGDLPLPEDRPAGEPRRRPAGCDCESAVTSAGSRRRVCSTVIPGADRPQGFHPARGDDRRGGGAGGDVPQSEVDGHAAGRDQGTGGRVRRGLHALRWREGGVAPADAGAVAVAGGVTHESHFG